MDPFTSATHGSHITSIIDGRAQTPDLPLTFAYDDANRLEWMKIGGVTTDDPAYNAAGQLYQKNASTSITYTTAGHANAASSTTSGNSYTYDANGNRFTRTIAGVTYTLTYDAENHLIGYVGGGINAAFVYDGDGQRVQGTINEVTTTYIGSHYEVQGTTTRKYYFAGSQRIAMRENAPSGETLFYFLPDHLGSTAVTVDAAGNLYGELRYSAWGETRYNRKDDLTVPVDQRHETPTNRRYTGQYAEPDLGIYYYGARWYDPALGRFTSPDAIIPDPYNSLDWDRYSYARNNPVRYSDPSGHCTGDPSDPNNKDMNCWNIYNKLKNKYTNVYIDSAFNIAFLQMIGMSLDQTLNAFHNSMGAFQKALGNFSIVFDPLISRAVTYRGEKSSSIHLGYSAFVKNNGLEPDSITVMLHEIGHVFDFKMTQTWPVYSSYKSELFISTFSPGCRDGYVGCVSSDASFLYKLLNFFSNGGTDGYNPSERVSAYGATSSIDDFAESFSGYVSRYNNFPTNIGYEQRREVIIATWINLASQ
jgi:RHS repeat-associated protein